MHLKPNLKQVILLKNLLFLIIIICLSACSTSRRQFLPGEIPEITTLESADEQYGHEVLNLMMDQYQLDRDDRNISRVREMVEKLAKEANSNQLPWHVYVFKDDSVENAAATRGNYIFIWTGMLNKVQNDDQLAAVVSHELAHLLAGHTKATPEEEAAEVFSQASGRVASEVLSQMGQYGALAGVAGALTKAIIDSMIVNPEQQRKELEADQIGLFLMAKSGYDPEKALEFWQHMNSTGSGDLGPLQFLTSHPSSEERLENLSKLIEQAKQIRDGAPMTISTTPPENKEDFQTEWTLKPDASNHKKDSN